MDYENPKLKEDVKSILAAYSRKLGKDEQFYNCLDQIGKHIIKLTKLKENEDRPGHFREEVVDMYILARCLIEIEGIDDNEATAASSHFVEVVDRVFA